jgi:hypothetical protein
MAEKRMFAKTIIDSDAFLELSSTARLLYYDLGMRADDDGVVNSPKKIMRMTGASEKDMTQLFESKFVIPFETGIIVIKHWKINNYLRKDRYTPSPYQKEIQMLTTDDNGVYRLTCGIPEVDHMVYQVETQNSIDKNSIDKNSIELDENEQNKKKKRFTKPTLDQVKEYLKEINSAVDAGNWYDYYESNGWKVAKNPMSDWKACCRNWSRKEKSSETNDRFKDVKL